MNSLDKAGSTPLHWAAHGGHIECMKALMEVPKCEINVQVHVHVHVRVCMFVLSYICLLYTF